MTNTNEPWRRKMVVQNIPDGWSQDMLENFMEVKTNAALENDGVEYFCGNSHTALLTFAEPLTDQHILGAQSGSLQKGKPLQFSLIQGPPTSVLIRDLSPTLTHDNLLYYFDSSHSGGVEGGVEDCDIHADHNLAIVTFTSHEVASGVLAVQLHQPSKGRIVYTEPCYDQFHKQILQDLKHSPASPPTPLPGGSLGRGQSAAPPRPPPPHNASAKSPAKSKPFTEPKQQPAPQHNTQSVPSRPGSQLSRAGGGGECEASWDAFSSRRQKANFQSYPNQSGDWQGESNENMAGHHRGYRGRKGKKKLGNQGRGWYGSVEEPDQQRKHFSEVENQFNAGGRGRGPHKGRYPQSSAGRGRGWGQRRGAFVSQPRETEMMGCGPAYECGIGLAVAPTPMSGPCHVIKLDAECNPIPQDDSSATNTTAWSVPPSGTRQLQKSGPDLNTDDHAVSLGDVQLSTESFGGHPDAEEYDSYLYLDSSGHRSSLYTEPEVIPVPHKTHPPPPKPTLCAAAPGVKSKQAHALPKTQTSRKEHEHSPLLQKASRGKTEAEEAAERLRKEQSELEVQRKLSQQIEEEKQRALEEKRRAELEAELQQARKKIAELENRGKWTERYPPYKLHLMHDFHKRCGLCDISIHAKEGTVEFHGSKDDYDAARLTFLLELQEMAEDSLSIPAVITTILQTPEGRQYLDQLHPGDPNRPVSFDVQDSCLVCVAHQMKTVQSFLSKVQANMQHGKCKANKCATGDLQALKQQLEKDFPLVRIKLPTGSGNELAVDGFGGDFELAVRELEDHFSKNKPYKGKFEIAGPLETKACKLWQTKELDSVKNLIWKNNGEVDVTDDTSLALFTLKYQCPKDVFQEVQKKLDDIRKVTKVHRVNLKSELKSYSEQCLMINGLHNLDIEPFCRLLEEKLKKEGGWESIIRFNLPPKKKLPQLRSAPAKPHIAAKQHLSKPRMAAPLQTHSSGHHRHHRGNSIRPFSTKVGTSILTVKSGDIALENVDGLVCVVGEDMDLKQTAVGQAILKQYPQVAQILPQAGLRGPVITKAIPQGSGRQTASTLYLAILRKQLQPNLQAHIKLMVQMCLQSAVRQGNRSVAFPPLGVGRKFQFSPDEVASAMLTTAYQFLQSNTRVLQSLTFVVFDADIARKFRKTAQQIIHPPMPPFLGLPQPESDSGSDQDDNGDDNDDDNDIDNDDGNDDDNDDAVACNFIPVASDDDRANSGSDGSDGDSLSFFNLDDEKDQALPPPVMMAAMAPAAFPTSSDNFEAYLCLRNSQDFSSVRSGLLRELKSTFVCEGTVEDMKTFGKLGDKTVEEVKSVALKKDVVLSVQSRGGKQVLVVRGQQVGVTELVALIKEKLHAHLSRVHKEEGREHRHRIGGLPSTADRVKLPSYWTICQNKLFKSIEQWIRDQRKYGNLHTVTGSPEYQEIVMLIDQTWQRHLVGHGKDARNLGHSKLQVSKVERLENPNLWEMYCTHRERLIRRMQQEQHGKGFLPVEKVKGSTMPVGTTSKLNRHSHLSREMFPQVNEHYLFHGTRKEYIDAIITQGLDTRIASEKSMLGRGVYASESSTKADQYTDDKTNRTSGNKTMLLMRVLLGEPYINKNSNPTKYQRPPCKSCYQDRCQCKNPALFDSVIDDAGRNFREFVIYERCMCYPEYFITYQRV